MTSKTLRNLILRDKIWEADESQVISKIKGLHPPLEIAPTIMLIKKFLSKYGFKNTLKVLIISYLI